MTGYLWHGKPDLERQNAEIMELRRGMTAVQRRDNTPHEFSWANAASNSKYYKPKRKDHHGTTTAA